MSICLSHRINQLYNAGCLIFRIRVDEAYRCASVYIVGRIDMSDGADRYTFRNGFVYIANSERRVLLVRVVWSYVPDRCTLSAVMTSRYHIPCMKFAAHYQLEGVCVDYDYKAHVTETTSAPFKPIFTGHRSRFRSVTPFSTIKCDFTAILC